MNNPKIYATGNENLNGDFNISYYIIEKDEKFLEWLNRLLIEVLDIKEEDKNAKVIQKIAYDNSGREVTEIYLKDINKMVDVNEHYGNKIDRVDVFYGQNRVYLTFRKSKETRKKFADFLLKTKDWIVIEKRPNFPIYIGERIK